MAGTGLGAAHPTISGLKPLLNDDSATPLLLIGFGTGAPDTTANIYQHGALFIRTDSGTGTNGVYQNTGSTAVPSWTLLDTGTAFSLPTSATDSTSTTGDSLLMTESTLTTGRGIRVLGTTANFTTGGELIKADLAAAVAGNGLSAVTTGAYTGTGLVKVTGTGMTSGSGILVTGGGANLLTGGKCVEVAMGAATVGQGVSITTTGAYTDTTNAVLNITATTASTTGNIVGVATISSKALMVGATLANPALQIDCSTSSQVAGLKITGAATGGTVAIATIDSGSAANLTINAKGTGTIGIGSVSTGAVTITPATTITGALTPTGGVAAAGGYSVAPRLMKTGGQGPLASTDFTDYTVVTTETIRAEIYVPANTSSTGVSIFNGSATAGNLTAYIIDSTGAQVATTASTAQSGTDAYQRIAWTGGPIALKGPATYWIAVQGNNTGAKINTHTVGDFGADKQTGTTYGTLTVAAAPTTFTTALGPVASLY